jgi:pimeloyl-ACP methyl ester carboxylesterase
MRHSLFLLFSLFFLFSLNAADSTAALLNQNAQIASDSTAIEKFYRLGPNENWKEITQEVLASPYTTAEARASIQSHQRKIFAIRYPSEGLWIKGFISFTPQANHAPTLMLFRTGNRNFALPFPGDDLATLGDYTILSSTLRGGISEGNDEFGGNDVADIKNLIDYLPTLNKELNFSSQSKCLFMIGPSRGGLEMFLTLARYPELQKRVTKVVALSSILDLHQQIASRPDDMKQMLIDDFGYQDSPSGEGWIAKRDPLKTIPAISQSLPILVVQGTADSRITLDEGYHMVNALKETGHQVDYWEIKNGNHTLTNFPQLTAALLTWLNTNVKCG